MNTLTRLLLSFAIFFSLISCGADSLVYETEIHGYDEISSSSHELGNSQRESIQSAISGYDRENQWTWEAEVTFELPSGLEAKSLHHRKAKLFLNEKYDGWEIIQLEDGRAYVPIEGLKKGTRAILSFDSFFDGKRWVGEASWTVDGRRHKCINARATACSIPVKLILQEGSLDDYGGVEITVLKKLWGNEQWELEPYEGARIYLGDWQAGHVLGYSEADGKAFFMLPAGMQKIDVLKNSHLFFGDSVQIEVEIGNVVGKTIQFPHFFPFQVLVHYDTGMGKALYITGENHYLGDWKTAYRLTWKDGNDWSFYKTLPHGTHYKIVMADWSNNPTISTNDVAWEVGPNRIAIQSDSISPNF